MRRKLSIDANGNVYRVGEPARDAEPDTPSPPPSADGGAGTSGNKSRQPVNMNDLIRAAARGGAPSDWARLREAGE